MDRIVRYEDGTRAIIPDKLKKQPVKSQWQMTEEEKKYWFAVVLYKNVNGGWQQATRLCADENVANGICVEVKPGDEGYEEGFRVSLGFPPKGALVPHQTVQKGGHILKANEFFVEDYATLIKEKFGNGDKAIVSVEEAEVKAVDMKPRRGRPKGS